MGWCVYCVQTAITRTNTRLLVACAPNAHLVLVGIASIVLTANTQMQIKLHAYIAQHTMPAEMELARGAQTEQECETNALTKHSHTRLI